MDPEKDWLLYEHSAAQEGYCVICGIDEAGRGPLAGPVFACACVMPTDKLIEGVNDSKKLSAQRREVLFDIITETAIDYAIAAVDERTIDEINILQATFKAMSEAAAQLSKSTPDLALIDGRDVPSQLCCEGRAIIKGDSLSYSIACASILAKVARDRYMTLLDSRYPQYGFAKHKGYGTKAHIEALRQYGASPVHRRSFLKKIEGIPNADQG